jgi:hypothetical protein
MLINQKCFMKKSVFPLALLAMIIFSVSCQPTYAVRERPEEVVYLRPAPPSPDHVWITGDWVWSGKKYEWREGHYETRRVGYRWVEGRWINVHGGWRWLRGYWKSY